ncbi:hypothetical protein DERF_014817 [Dermatophagoides farinae]|uniref:Uncharacterized protein n=1 Tax=Dermatophagoides farinae TaxID=6954 RepID=A0A922HMZ3_DERFA|nr:hypothetical protein DERF_014817 [Dermatophagoides farinae]
MNGSQLRFEWYTNHHLTDEILRYHLITVPSIVMKCKISIYMVKKALLWSSFQYFSYIYIINGYSHEEFEERSHYAPFYPTHEQFGVE